MHSIYQLKFLPEALEEWNRLDGSVKSMLRKLLKKRLTQPHTPGAQLHGDLRNCYKIKLRKCDHQQSTSAQQQGLLPLP